VQKLKSMDWERVRVFLKVARTGMRMNRRHKALIAPARSTHCFVLRNAVTGRAFVGWSGFVGSKPQPCEIQAKWNKMTGIVYYGFDGSTVIALSSLPTSQKLK
jgi:hypothetical protein